MGNEEFTEVKNVVFRQVGRKSECPVQFRSNLNWERNKKQIELLTRIAPRGGRVLDLGCGWGHTTAMLAVSRPDLEIIGLDLQRGPTWKEFEKYGCRFQVGDALNLKIKDKIDLVVSFGVMEHVKDDRKFLKEINKVLRQRGSNIVFNLPNRYSLSEFFAKALEIWHHERTYTRRQIVQLFADEGFKILEIRREDIIPAQVGRIHWTFEDLFNRACSLLDKFDKLLSSTRLNFFSQDFTIVSRKASESGMTIGCVRSK
jgi:ubiquinone/menaquinone biosynthesis C-methylase UbiE